MRNLTQNELALLVGVDTKSISNYERGVAYPSIQTLILISKAVKYPMEYFVSVEKNNTAFARLLIIEQRLSELITDLKDIKQVLK
ncbi:helix-turn-helix transcriptional regulator [Candidatus Dojkabacteria bacterium]|nr:helix-turn-helix transcriptional regulator [Candidatus Dojkabacteria bacterium]